MSVPAPPGPPDPAWPSTPSPKPSTLGYWGVAFAAMIAVLLAAVLVVMLVKDDGSSSDEFALDESDGYLVLYEPPTDEGPQPFMSIEDREEATGTTTSSLPEGVTTTLPEGAFGEIGLYGGSLEQTCNPDLLIWYLERNPDKAAAFAAALGIPVEAIPDFIRSLTPSVLRSDVRVTNHGYVDGTPTPRQSVLPAGTAVMIDQTGFPRVRCYCGNPLKPPDEPPPCTCPPGTTPDLTTTTTLVEDTTTTTKADDTTTTTAVEMTTTTSSTTTTTRPPPTTTTTRPPPTTTTTRPPPTTTTTTIADTTTSSCPPPGIATPTPGCP